MRGYKGVKTTMIESYMLNPGRLWVRSSADFVELLVHEVRGPVNYMYC